MDKDTIYIYDQIGLGGILPKTFIDELESIKGPLIHIKINSAGGAVFEGMAIYNAIKRCKIKTRAYIDGVAYGIAAIIALACDEIYMKKRSYLAISEPKVHEISDKDRANPDLEKIKNIMVEIYMEKSKKTKAEIIKMMEQETRLTDCGALIDGFVDYIYG